MADGKPRRRRDHALPLDEVILLAVHANPDGHALVANWYMRHDDPLERTTQGVPVLYNKYAGHDNNRDFYMASLAESENMNRVMYREWFPADRVQPPPDGPAGHGHVRASSFRDPPNHNLDPLIITSLDQVGSAMHHRMVMEGQGRDHNAARRRATPRGGTVVSARRRTSRT